MAMLMRALPPPAQLDEHGIKRTLQAAIDHYPRLIALRVTLRLPDPSTEPLDALITRFHAALLQLINVFIDSRQSAGKAAPPTQISLLWGAGADTGLPDGAIPILLLLNQDTFYSFRHDPSLQTQIDAANALISKAWSSAKPGHQLPIRLTNGCRLCCRKPFTSRLPVVNPIPTHPSMLRLATTRCSYLPLYVRPGSPPIINSLRHPAR